MLPVIAALLLCPLVTHTTVAAQSIAGVLVDGETGTPIPFGLILMFTEEGDSVGGTITDDAGRFGIASPEPGDFLLRASAFGYEERVEGVFELGPGGTLEVRYALRAAPLPIDEVIVSLDRPTRLHHLVHNGFVTRLQRGLGHFITPYQIEQSSAATTEQLMAGLPGVRIGHAYFNAPPPSGDSAVYLIFPRPGFAESILIQSSGGWCPPTVYVDGARIHYDPGDGYTLSSMVGRREIEAIEIYRRPAELPVEYRAGTDFECGVLVAWSKTGLAPGQRPSRADSADPSTLPSVSDEGTPVEVGERFRAQVSPELAASLPRGAVFEGQVIDVRGDGLVAAEDLSGRTMALPAGAVEEIQVLRPREPRYAFVRGGLAGAGMAVGTWAGLSVLCTWSSCARSAESLWIPSVAAGAAIGWLVYRAGPGDRWVRTTLPELGPAPEGLALLWRVRR